MSQTAQGAETRITMDRWLNTYIVADGHNGQAATHDVLRRIDRRIAEELPAACARRLGSRFDHAGTAVWRIRELQFDFTVDISMPAAADVAASWSECVAGCIAEIIERGAEDDGILRFADRAAYQAQFALDLAAGRAWSKWYFQEFFSLAALTTSRATREMLTREPEQGVQALLHLVQIARLDEILVVLTDGDAEAIYKQCFGGTAGFYSPEQSFSYSLTELSLWAGRLLEIWNQEPMRPASIAHKDFHDALRWIARLAVRFPDAEIGPAMCAALDGLIELRRVLAALPSAFAADRLVRDLVQQKRSLEHAITLALNQGAVSPENALHFLLKVAESDHDWAAQVAAVLLRDQRPPNHAAFAGESMITPFGGIFLIGPALVKWNQVLEMAIGEGPEKKEIAGFLRYLILAKCLGNSRTLDAMADPALRLLSGCHRSHLEDGRQACLPLDLPFAQMVLLRNLTALTGCEGRCLLVETVSAPSQTGEVILLRDLARDEWIYGAVLPHETAHWEEVLVSALELIRELTGNVPYLLLRPSLATLAESKALQSRADRLVTADPEEISSEAAEVLMLTRCVPASTPPVSVAHLLRPCDQDFAYLSFGNLWPDFDVELDLFGTLIARAALKQFARQPMGFQSSSPDHLCRNFIEGVGIVHDRPERIEVELPRSPLFLVLQLSGLARQAYAVPWLEGREICLLPPGE
ncbi:MAG TPA: hypothetical protein VI636_25235 [Candidatus Angelobacter sp.]